MTALLHAKGLVKRFGQVVAANDIDVELARGVTVGLIGTNGAGKTTFVNMITGYLKPDSGQILLDGVDVTPLSPREITRLGVCRSFQIPQLFGSQTAFDNLRIGLGAALRNSGTGGFLSGYRGLVPGYGMSVPDVADLLLERFGIGDFRNKRVRTLPGGVRKMLDVALVMTIKPKIVLLDEPTSGVSADEKLEMVSRTLNAIRLAGATVMFIEHDMDIVKRFSERVLAFAEGRVIADGLSDSVFAQDNVQRLVLGRRHHTHPGAPLNA